MFRALIVVSFLSLLLANCVHAADAPAPVPNTPEGVAQAFTKAIGGVFLADPNEIPDEIRPLVVTVPEKQQPGGGPAWWYFTTMLLWLQTTFGAQTVPQPAVEGDHATVDLQSAPLHLVLAKVDGLWKVDMQATFKLLPAALRKAVEGEPGANEPRAMQMACMSNLKQLGLAAHMYANDHDKALPDADTWTEELKEYAKNDAVFRCTGAPKLQWAYAMNRELSGKRIDQIHNPWETVLFFESDLNIANASGGPEDVCKPGRHEGGNVFLFVDGHVMWWKGEGFPRPGQPGIAPKPGAPAEGPGAAGPPPG